MDRCTILIWQYYNDGSIYIYQWIVRGGRSWPCLHTPRAELACCMGANFVLTVSFRGGILKLDEGSGRRRLTCAQLNIAVLRVWNLDTCVCGWALIRTMSVSVFEGGWTVCIDRLCPLRQSYVLDFVRVCPSVWYVGHCGGTCTSVSPILCWALWEYVCQSDMLGFVGVHVHPSVRYVGHCGGMSVSLIYWALWGYVCQSDMLGFVGVHVCLSVQHVGLCGSMSVSLISWALWGYVYICQSDILGFVGVCPSVWYLGLCGGTRTSVSPICWALWECVCESDMMGFVGVCLSFLCWMCRRVCLRSFHIIIRINGKD